MAIAQPSVGGVSIPASVYGASNFMFYPQEYEIAGDGTAVPYGTQSAVWRYEVMTQAQLLWWRWVALQGANSRSTTFALWTNNDRETTTAFTSGIVYGPRWAEVQALPGGYYGPVEIRFDYLLPIAYGLSPFVLASSALGGSDVLVGAYYG